MKNILIVEDEFILARNISGILKAEGYQCIAYIPTYDDALAAISEHSPNLVLIDIMLPGGSGLAHLGRAALSMKRLENRWGIQIGSLLGLAILAVLVVAGLFAGFSDTDNLFAIDQFRLVSGGIIITSIFGTSGKVRIG